MAKTRSTPSRMRQSTTICPPLRLFMVAKPFSVIEVDGLRGDATDIAGKLLNNSVVAPDHIRDSEGVRGNGECRVHHWQGGKERGVHHEEVADVVGTTGPIQDGRGWVSARGHGPCLMGVDLHGRTP